MRITKPIRLFWGENYSEKPKLIVKLLREAADETINQISLYPGNLYDKAIHIASKELGVMKDQIIFGHGIEGLINITAQTFIGDNGIGGMFNPSFFVFGNNLKRYKNISYPCNYSREINVDDFIDKIEDTNVFFVASPNTATGAYLLSRNEIEKVLKVYKGILVVDECYFGIGGQSVLDFVKTYKNLIVYRGMTKVMGMGSLRLGVAISNKENIDKMRFHLNDIELDPINSFSLNCFIKTFPYYKLLSENTNKFFGDFMDLLQKEFPNDKFIKNVTTFNFMNISRYDKKSYKIINYMNEHGYLFESENLKNDSGILYPEFIMLTPPPRKFWKDFIKILKEALR